MPATMARRLHAERHGAGGSALLAPAARGCGRVARPYLMHARRGPRPRRAASRFRAAPHACGRGARRRVGATLAAAPTASWLRAAHGVARRPALSASHVRPASRAAARAPCVLRARRRRCAARATGAAAHGGERATRRSGPARRAELHARARRLRQLAIRARRAILGAPDGFSQPPLQRSRARHVDRRRDRAARAQVDGAAGVLDAPRGSCPKADAAAATTSRSCVVARSARRGRRQDGEAAAASRVGGDAPRAGSPRAPRRSAALRRAAADAKANQRPRRARREATGVGRGRRRPPAVSAAGAPERSLAAASAAVGGRLARGFSPAVATAAAAPTCAPRVAPAAARRRAGG